MKNTSKSINNYILSLKMLLYDCFNRVTAEIQNGTKVEKEYDLNSNPVKTFYPSGLIVGRSYDSLNNLTSVYDQTGTIAAFSYDKDRLLTKKNLVNNISETRNYSNKGEITNISISNFSSSIYKYNYTYDADSNLTKETITKNNQTIIKDYSYDNLNRLLKESNQKNAELKTNTWKYDKVGNWIETNQNGETEKRTVNRDNEYSSIQNSQFVIQNYSYDANGNLTFDGVYDYIYDGFNRLSEIKLDGQPVSRYTYDALNRRASKFIIQNSQFIIYIYSGQQVIEEYEHNELARTFTYGSYIDDVLTMDTNGQRYFYLKDRQYNVIALTDSNGNVVERYEYNPYGLPTTYNASGEVIFNSIPNGGTVIPACPESFFSQFGNSYGFTGRRYDSETGLYYYRNRMYSPVLGRFLQRDPAGYVDGMNLYAYVKNNPLRYLDPMGLTAKDSNYYESFTKDSNWKDWTKIDKTLNILDSSLNTNQIKDPNKTGFYLVYREFNDAELKEYYPRIGHFYLAFDGNGKDSTNWVEMVTTLGKNYPRNPESAIEKDTPNPNAETFSFHPWSVESRHDESYNRVSTFDTIASYIGYNDDVDQKAFINARDNLNDPTAPDVKLFPINVSAEKQHELYKYAIESRNINNQSPQSTDIGYYKLATNNCGTWTRYIINEKGGVEYPHEAEKYNLFGSGIGGVINYTGLPYLVTGTSIAIGSAEYKNFDDNTGFISWAIDY